MTQKVAKKHGGQQAKLQRGKGGLTPKWVLDGEFDGNCRQSKARTQQNCRRLGEEHEFEVGMEDAGPKKEGKGTEGDGNGQQMDAGFQGKKPTGNVHLEGGGHLGGNWWMAGWGVHIFWWREIE